MRWETGQTERRIRELEIQEAQEQVRRERARAETLWKIQPQRSSSVALLHRGGCATYPDQIGLISREDAMVALAEPDIEPCKVCRPDTGLRGRTDTAGRTPSRPTPPRTYEHVSPATTPTPADPAAAPRPVVRPAAGTPRRRDPRSECS
ncbi:DUF6233 domain-containing protein [Micromonospora sp. NPDC050397]|uniref:DUF6233 domain-containing protein n=1 Tax=Micromonospora sp. NPDC050397 TaxID=3364279 RepID=UPI0038504C08